MAIKESLQVKEEKVKALAAAGRQAEAMDLLFALVTACAAARRFDHAERLQQQMMEVDAMAIGLIVAAAERIEEEKNKAIDKDHLENWRSWYARLMPEERSAFFFATKARPFVAGEVLFRKGEENNTLFFVDQGSLNLVSLSDGGAEVVARRLGPGEIGGKETFYKSSLCTTSLVALTGGLCRTFTREALLSLTEKLPGLGPKLRDFCMESRSASDALKARGINRRAHKRVPAQGVIVFQVLAAENKNGAASLLKGRMADISAGGLSFYVKTANGRGIRQLLGRPLGMKFLLSTVAKPHSMVCKGSVTCVLCHMDNEYSIHVKFDKLLDPMYFV